MIFNSDLIDRYIAIIGLALDVFHRVSLFQKVFRLYMTHGPKNISLDFFVATVKLFQHQLNFTPFRGCGGWTGIYEIRKSLTACKSPDQILIGKRQGTNQGKPLLKQCLRRHHRADFTCKANIHKQGFDDVIEKGTFLGLDAFLFQKGNQQGCQGFDGRYLDVLGIERQQLFLVKHAGGTTDVFQGKFFNEVIPREKFLVAK